MQDKSEVILKLNKLKSVSGSHSPSIETLKQLIPEIEIEIDACFLSNPYATDFFMSCLEDELIKTGKLREILEFYPPQNRDVAEYVSSLIQLPTNQIFIGNGAIEIIQAVLHNFVSKKLLIVLPTFSSYYEFIKEDCEVVYYQLKKENDFILDVDDFLNFVKTNEPDSVVLINPNNPNGGFFDKKTVVKILDNCPEVGSFIIDESFIHFAIENNDLINESAQDLSKRYENLIVIKSMSKDFGIAGIRAGYAIMRSERVNYLLKNGYLWNVSGLSAYFFRKYSEPDFQRTYEILRRKYIAETRQFMLELEMIKPNIKVYPSKGNFVIIELLNGITSRFFTMNLLLNHNIYVRDCSDKVGLDGEFVRVASRSFDENRKIIDAIRIVQNL